MRVKNEQFCANKTMFKVFVDTTNLWKYLYGFGAYCDIHTNIKYPVSISHVLS